MRRAQSAALPISEPDSVVFNQPSLSLSFGNVHRIVNMKSDV